MKFRYVWAILVVFTFGVGFIGCGSGGDTAPVVKNNTAPTAVAGTDQTVTQGNSITLNASKSSDSDGSITSYEWKEHSTVLSTLSSFSKSDFTVGTHTITLTVTDNDGATASDRVIVTVTSIANKAPIANAGVDQNVTLGTNVTLNASASSDSDGTITSYEWKEGNTVLSTSSSFTKSDFTVGTHTITLTVTDNDGATASDTVTVTINALVSNSTIKKTGQTKSYNANGNEVTDNSLKDDGYYQEGATPDYTRASDMVTDALTGLMWQDDAAAKTTQKKWLTDANYNTCSNNRSSPACYDTSGDTAATYCSDLVLGGYTDWRLPTASELEGIMDYGKVAPSINTTYFNNVSSNYYWSSTTYEGNKNYAWLVDFYDGNVNNLVKDGNNYVRCVRGGQ